MPNTIDIHQLIIDNETFNLEDAFSREQIEILKKAVEGGTRLVGATTTALKDKDTTSAVTIKKGDTTEDHTAKAGDIVFYTGTDGNDVAFVFSSTGQWDQLGSAGMLKALAYKDSVSAFFTPAGSVSVTPTTADINQIDGVGTLPSLETSVDNGVLTINFSAGTLPTKKTIKVATGVQNATFNGTPATIVSK